MFGSTILEIGACLCGVFLLLSLVCTAVREALESVLRTRSVYLEKGIRELLQDPTGKELTERIYNHPIVSGLFQNKYVPEELSSRRWMPLRGTLPSYIPAANFALAFMQVVTKLGREEQPAAVGGARRTLDTIDSASLRRGARVLAGRNLPAADIVSAVLDAAGDDLAEAQRHLERWFDNGMDRVSGWYKRRTYQIILVLSLVITVAANADTLSIARALSVDGSVRSAVVSRMETLAETEPVGAFDLQDATKVLQNVELPIGWGHRAGLPDPMTWGALPKVVWTHLGGWLLTALCVSLGAPFWFDVLNRVMVIRSTVKPHEKSPEEGSEDRAPRVAPDARPVPARARASGRLWSTEVS